MIAALKDDGGGGGETPKKQRMATGLYLSDQAREALEYLRSHRPGGFNLAKTVERLILREAKRFGWIPPTNPED